VVKRGVCANQVHRDRVIWCITHKYAVIADHRYKTENTVKIEKLHQGFFILVRSTVLRPVPYFYLDFHKRYLTSPGGTSIQSPEQQNGISRL